jgi:hypothetical protein
MKLFKIGAVFAPGYHSRGNNPFYVEIQYLKIRQTERK